MSASYSSYYKLGLTGLALLRNWLKGDIEFCERIIKEAQEVIDNYPLTKKEESLIEEFSSSAGYSKWATNYDQMPNLLLDAEQPQVTALLRSFQPGKVVDLACGTGRYTTLLKKLDHQVIGIDQSESMLTIARQKDETIKYIQGDISNTPFSDGEFDLVNCSLALSHSKDLEKPINEISRILKKGGTAVLSDIHPMIVALGGHADFISKEGERGFVENYVHWHSDYISNFLRGDLQVVNCIEPYLAWEHVRVLQDVFQLKKETMESALVGLPIALIWVLKKS